MTYNIPSQTWTRGVVVMWHNNLSATSALRLAIFYSKMVSHPWMKWSEQVGDVVGLHGVMTVATLSTFNWELLGIQQWVLERIHIANWLQVVGVTRIQGYQAPVCRKKSTIIKCKLTQYSEVKKEKGIWFTLEVTRQPWLVENIKPYHYTQQLQIAD